MGGGAITVTLPPKNKEPDGDPVNWCEGNMGDKGQSLALSLAYSGRTPTSIALLGGRRHSILRINMEHRKPSCL